MRAAFFVDSQVLCRHVQALLTLGDERQQLAEAHAANAPASKAHCSSLHGRGDDRKVHIAADQTSRCSTSTNRLPAALVR